MGSSSIPSVLLSILGRIEPGANFTGTLPKVKSSRGKIYFVKLGSINEEEQYVGESTSLQEINAAAPGLAPNVVLTGCLDDGRPYMITKYKETGFMTDEAAALLGRRLATELHGYKSTRGFGFDVPTFCGATRQPSGWYKSWEECFSALLGNLLDQLKGRSQYRDLCRKGEEVRSRIIPKLLGKRYENVWPPPRLKVIKGSLHVQPVLLHGDLWSGNIGLDKGTGEPFIFDPSSYFGHNEADLAIGRMFGGIPQSFFDTYHQYFPKAKPVDQYTSRCDLYELYHYLNHTVLFGGGYAAGAIRKMDKLLAAL